METRKNSIIAILVVIVVVLSAALVYSNFKTPGRSRAAKRLFTERMEGKRAKHQPFYADMNLTAEQKRLLEENKTQHKEKARVLSKQIHSNMLLIRQELQKDDLNTGKIEQIQDKLKKLQIQMLDDRLQSILEVRKILTPEQFREFSARIESKIGKDKRNFKGRPPIPMQEINGR